MNTLRIRLEKGCGSFMNINNLIVWAVAAEKEQYKVIRTWKQLQYPEQLILPPLFSSS